MGTTSFSNLLPELAALAIEARGKTEQGHWRQTCIPILEGAFEVRFGVRRVTADLWEPYHALKAKRGGGGSCDLTMIRKNPNKVRVVWREGGKGSATVFLGV